MLIEELKSKTPTAIVMSKKKRGKKKNKKVISNPTPAYVQPHHFCQKLMKPSLEFYRLVY